MIRFPVGHLGLLMGNELPLLEGEGWREV